MRRPRAAAPPFDRAATTIRAVNLVAVAIPVDGPEEVEAALDAARAAVRDGARLVEWRVDALADRLLPEHAGEALDLVRRLVRDSPAPCIVTVRSASEGGAYRGHDADRISLYEAIGAGEHAPRYLDLECAAFERSANLRQKARLAVAHERQPRDLKTSLILSAHDFDGRPADLQGRIAAMTSEPACAVVKAAWRARSLRDNLEAFELLRERRKPMVALCMGDFGLMSRVLAPKFGGFFTFARGAATAETAAGQPTVRELFDRWRYARIGTATRVYGVVGWPVGHSRSPDLHNAGFDARGIDAVYLPMPVEGSWESFKATVGAMLDFEPLDVGGLSVTVPHKEHLVRFVRERGGTLCPVSERCGTANTLVVGGGANGAARGASPRALHAVNTDAPAAVRALESAAPAASAPSSARASRDSGSLRGRRIALLGAGGTARALAAALVDGGADVVVFNRTRDRAEALAARIAGVTVGGSLDEVASNGAFDVIVNTTPIGLRGSSDEDRSPLADDFRFGRGTTVMDVVYAPRLTPLLRRAREAGATTLDGSTMFVHQAEAQFELWTGAAPPPGLFRATLDSLEPAP